ncbi:glycosyltransferase family 2 protein [uncultured Mucilaginibacter sp.]|uniref:glycosyltransferase family 2 protein n=1 Tax=uncultured Mucilaginibacter sp. TaxID=797541 RepID=UPI00261D4E87|nr:glycosyltransferase family 2 protein [uncultured Mucilaginibacter sp.]
MKISVVMATYNGEKYLEQQIKSILGQTLKPDEFIVCDDNSTDGTIKILEKYKQLFKLTYVVNTARLGVINNFVKAVSLAAPGNYISLADQDDEWMPDKLEKSVQRLKEIDDAAIPCMVYSDLMLVDRDENLLNISFWNEVGQQEKYQHNLQTLLFGQFVNGCTTILNPALRRMFKNIPDKVRFHHDDWIAVAAFAFGKVASIKEPLVKYRKHGNNVTIKTNTKPRNRYRTLTEQLFKVIQGKDDFLSIRFELARLFYDQYAPAMTAEVKQCFEKFIALEGRSYFAKKIAFRRVVKKFQIEEP